MEADRLDRSRLYDLYGDRHIQRAIEAAGYTCELRLRPDFAARLPYNGKLLEGEAETRKRIIENIDRGSPVIALGIVGPAEPCLVAGYDEDGVRADRLELFPG